MMRAVESASTAEAPHAFLLLYVLVGWQCVWRVGKDSIPRVAEVVGHGLELVVGESVFVVAFPAEFESVDHGLCPVDRS